MGRLLAGGPGAREPRSAHRAPDLAIPAAVPQRPGVGLRSSSRARTCFGGHGHPCSELTRGCEWPPASRHAEAGARPVRPRVARGRQRIHCPPSACRGALRVPNCGPRPGTVAQAHFRGLPTDRWSSSIPPLASAHPRSPPPQGRHPPVPAHPRRATARSPRPATVTTAYLYSCVLVQAWTRARPEAGSVEPRTRLPVSLC